MGCLASLLLGCQASLLPGKELPFDDPAAEAIYEITCGNLRAINYLSRKALQKAAEQNVATIDTTLVLAARKDLIL